MTKLIENGYGLGANETKDYEIRFCELLAARALTDVADYLPNWILKEVFPEIDSYEVRIKLYKAAILAKRGKE